MYDSSIINSKVSLNKTGSIFGLSGSLNLVPLSAMSIADWRPLFAIQQQNCENCMKVTLKFDIYSFNSVADNDECFTNSHGCDVNAVCNNTRGSHTCICNAGYSGDGRTCSGTFLIKFWHASVFTLTESWELRLYDMNHRAKLIFMCLS